MRYFVYTNLFISLVAAAMSWETLQLYGLDLPAYIPFIFSSTLASYSIHARINSFYQPAEARHEWNRRNSRLLSLMIIFGGLGAGMMLSALLHLSVYFRLHS